VSIQLKIKHFCIALILASSTAIADSIPGSYFRVGNWDGQAYSHDDTGTFSHCAISTGYVSGDVLFFSVNRQVTVMIAVSSPALADVPIGHSFPVVLYVDRRAPFHGTATIQSNEFAMLEIADFDRALESFKRGYTLTVQGAGRTGSYDLTGTFHALEATRDCAIRYFNHISAPSTPTHAQPDKTTSFQLATTILTGLGIQSFRFLSQDELNDAGTPDAVAWTASDHKLSGWSLLMPRNRDQDDIKDTDLNDIAVLAQRCQGDYATSARSIALKNGTTARELRLMCLEKDSRTEHFLSKFFSGDFVVYNALMFISWPDDQQNGKMPSQWSDDVTLRAVSYFMEHAKQGN